MILMHVTHYTTPIKLDIQVIIGGLKTKLFMNRSVVRDREVDDLGVLAQRRQIDGVFVIPVVIFT